MAQPGITGGVSTSERSTLAVTNALPLAGGRAVGDPAGRGLLAAYFGVALAGWLAATVAGIVAAPDLAAGRPLAPDVLLAVHLVALGVLPFAVSGACFHLLPMMLRNPLPSQRLLWLAFPLLGGGFLVAAGLGRDAERLVWVGAAMVTCGLGIVLYVVAVLVVRAPRGRMLIASRLGVAGSGLHVVVALAVGAAVFSRDAAFDGIAYQNWLLIHLHLALLGWIALLTITVGRALGPMLARSPVAPRRDWPVDELVLIAGLWLLLAGLAIESRPLTLGGGVVVVVALGRFALLMVGTARTRRGPLEPPLAHLLVGGLCLAQAAVAGLVLAAGGGGIHLACAYVVLLLVGWAVGVVLGHVGKLLSLSVWVWWPPGPRPQQAKLYPRRLGLAAAGAFLVGVEALAIGTASESDLAARAGAVLLCASALMSLAGAVQTWERRARHSA